MSEKPNNRNSDEDAVLNQLIRACRDKEPADGLVRPDKDAIAAYLMGTADEEQKKAVRSALARSKEFRQEILNIAQDMATLAELDLASYEKEAQQIPVPDLQEFLEPIPIPAEPVPFRIKLKKFWGKLTELRIPQLYAPAVTAAAVLVFVIIQTGIFAPDRTWSLVYKNMERGLLVSNVTRTTESKKAYATPDLAALAEIRFLLNFDFESGQFLLNPSEERFKPPSPLRDVLLQLIDAKDNLIQQFPAHIPVTEASSSEPVMAWVLGMPSKNLYSLQMKSDTVEVKWDEDMGSYGCITFTYRDKEGYQAVVGFTFDLR